MRAVNHGLTGAAIAVVVKQPMLAVPLALISHFVCDAIPHSGTGNLDIRDKKFLRILYADMALAVVSTLAVASVWQERWWLVIVCAFFAASPDLAWAYYRYFNPRKKLDSLSKFHKWIQWSETLRGYYLEAVWFIVFLGSLMYLGVK